VQIVLDVQICRCEDVQMCLFEKYPLIWHSYKYHGLLFNNYQINSIIKASAHLHICTSTKKALSLTQDGFNIIIKNNY